MHRSNTESFLYNDFKKVSNVVSKVLLMRRDQTWKRGFVEKAIKPPRKLTQSVSFQQHGTTSAKGYANILWYDKIF